MKSAQIQLQLTHCVFRRGDFWLALPAGMIRNVMPKPALVKVPHTHRVLIGLAHERGEFIPVFSLDPVLAIHELPGEQFLIVMEDSDGAWGILVDAVSGLASLEHSSAPETSTSWSSAISGWATHDLGVVRILDHVRYRELAEQALTSAK